jgi:hypothetical protein
MQKILILIFFVFSIVVGSTLSASAAGCDTADVTSPCFTVSLSNMDPLGSSHTAVYGEGGIGAFTILLGRVTDILLFMIPIFAAVSLMIAGYFYIFSAGDSEKANKAKTIIKWNIVSILVAFLSYGIVQIVASFFNT